MFFGKNDVLSEYAQELFWRIDREKRERVINAAVSEFAKNGFQNANVNKIAEAAGISVGSLYKYFPTKENLFRCIIEISTKEIETAIYSVVNGDAPFMDKVEALIAQAQRYSREEPLLIRLYGVFTAEGNSELAGALSDKLESISANAYRSLIARAQEAGEVRRDVDAGTLAVMMDNQLMMIQFSYACDYYKKRFDIYVGCDNARNDAFVRENTMKVMRSMFLGGGE